MLLYIIIYTIQRVTNIELQETTVKETFIKYDVEIHRRLKDYYRGYYGSNPNPNYWSNLVEEDLDFEE